jgi:hypothetical protein
MTNLVLLIGEDAGEDLSQAAGLHQHRIHRAGWSLLRTQPKSRRCSPGVILLDFVYSPKPAFEILRWLPTEQRFKEVPVFVLAPQTVDVSEAYALGANSCFIQDQAREGLEPIVSGIAAYASLIGERVS